MQKQAISDKNQGKCLKSDYSGILVLTFRRIPPIFAFDKGKPHFFKNA